MSEDDGPVDAHYEHGHNIEPKKELTVFSMERAELEVGKDVSQRVVEYLSKDWIPEKKVLERGNSLDGLTQIEDAATIRMGQVLLLRAKDDYGNFSWRVNVNTSHMPMNLGEAMFLGTEVYVADSPKEMLGELIKIYDSLWD